MGVSVVVPAAFLLFDCNKSIFKLGISNLHLLVLNNVFLFVVLCHFFSISNYHKIINLITIQPIFIADGAAGPLVFITVGTVDLFLLILEEVRFCNKEKQNFFTLSSKSFKNTIHYPLLGICDGASKTP